MQAVKHILFYTGANHLGGEIPKGIAGAILSGGFILPLNICVGIIVAFTMYGFLCTIFERRFINMEVILAHYYDIAAVILFGIGFFTLLLHRNLIKKIIGLNIMDTSIFLFLASKGYIFGACLLFRKVSPMPRLILIRYQADWC